MKTIAVFTAVAALLLQSLSAQSQFQADLRGTLESPPNGSPARGIGTVCLNASQTLITVDLNFSGLTAPATAAHIHGPGGFGTNAAVLFPLSGVPAATSGTVPEQVFSISAAQVDFLSSGYLYLNVHTANFPGGEIRDQLFLVGGCVFPAGIYSLTTRVVGGGSIAKSPEQTTYPNGSTVKLTAVPASGWAFSSWSDDASGAQNPLSLTMTNDKRITANFVVAPVSCSNAPSGLVNWWRAEGDASDAQANNSGTLQYGTTFAAGKVGQAFSFDGVDDVVLINAAALSPPWTAETWVQRQDSPADVASLLTGNGGWGLKLEQYPNTRKVGISTFGGADDYTFNYTAPVGTWVHLAFVGNSGSTQLYTNGVLADTINTGISLPLTKLGVMKGLVDEMSVYNRALSATEIQNIYNAGSLGKCPQPACELPQMFAWWPGGSNANDVIGGQNGVVHGATYAPGKVGTAFSFNGVSDYIEAPFSRPSYEAVSIEAWIKTSGTADYSSLVNKFLEYNPINHNVARVGFLLGFHTGGTLSCDVGDGTGDISSAYNPTVVTDGRWHHVAAVFNASQMVLYVDGVPGTPVTPTGYEPTNDVPLDFGRYPGHTDRYFSGLLDEVSLYDFPLSASQVQAIYNAGSAGKCLTPVYIASVNRSNNNVSLSWLSQNGISYRVQSNSTLTGATWTDATSDMTATGGTTSTSISDPAQQRFYRVQMFR